MEVRVSNCPSKYFPALQSFCSSLSVVLLSYDSRSTLILRLDCRKKMEGIFVLPIFSHYVLDVWVVVSFGDFLCKKLQDTFSKYMRLISDVFNI